MMEEVVGGIMDEVDIKYQKRKKRGILFIILGDY